MLLKQRIILPNVERYAPARDRKAALLRMIVWSAVFSVMAFLVIYFTLPRARLSSGGLVVYSSVVALVGFLSLLLMRYFATLTASFLFVAKYTVKNESESFRPLVSIIIPVYNEAKILRDSIKSLLQLNYENYEIIIVNDGSTDDTSAVAQSLVGYHQGKSAHIKVSLINKANGGKATALNAGIQHSTADFVLCMDGDSQLTPETLNLGIRHFVDPDLGAVAGNVKVLNRNRLLTNLQTLEYVQGLNLVRSAQSFLGMVNIIPGPVGIFRKRAIQDGGWYSSDTFAEDADLTLKIRVAGWKIIYEPNAISYTEAPESIHQLLKQRYRWTRGILQSLRKHRRQLYRSSSGALNTLVLWSMFYEAIMWPTMNIFTNLFFIVVALFYGMSNLIPLWWASIALLDIMAALYCVAVDKEELRLVPYAFIYRLFFILMIDITKAAATIEEFLGMEMTWGKLERIGAPTN